MNSIDIREGGKTLPGQLETNNNSNLEEMIKKEESKSRFRVYSNAESNRFSETFSRHGDKPVYYEFSKEQIVNMVFGEIIILFNFFKLFKF